MARDDDPAVRASLAERSDLPPEVLYYLAQDDSADVRKAVAGNLTAPRQTIELLVQDESEVVREGLVTRIVTLTPRIHNEKDSKLKNSTHDALSALAKDQTVKVRETMTAAIKDRDGIPVDIVRTLAVDTEVSVSAPVLEYSPVLTDDILLEIIESGTVSDNLCAISRREKVSESVSDAVVNTDDTSAIGELLSNSSAQIREEVLDDLIDRAADVDIWHEPLINRPKLPSDGPQKLANFVGGHLLESLKSRDDMDDETKAEVEALVYERMENEADDSSRHGLFDFLEGPVSMALVDRLNNSGGLRSSVISSALQAGDHKFVLAALIVLSDLPEVVVKRIFSERNPKAIVSLVWKSGLPVSLITALQKRMARIPPGDVLEATTSENADSSDGFPMSEKEMNWNIQFFSNLVDRDSHAANV